ncbi:MAG: SusC/RagA family TonB-linked outer membrane protein [Bacteroidales bacterium]
MKKSIPLLFFLCFLLSASVLAQTRVITGVVTDDQDGSPIPGVTVFIKNTNIGTTTDFDGAYSLSIMPENKIVVFSFVGMQTQEIEIGNQESINISLNSIALEIDEVVVTAIGIPKEAKALGYSVQKVDGEELSKTANTNIVNSLAGRVADVKVTSSSGAVGASSFITIRGASSITGNNQPLFVVDGIPIDNGGGAGGPGGVALSNRAIDLNPEDIESVNVLKGGAATALYGIRGANGVIVITTKKGVATEGKKINVNFNSSVTISQVSRLPKLTKKYGQGEDGNWISGFNGNWGPKLDTCFYNPAAANVFDVYGSIVGPNMPNGGERVNAFDQYNFFQTGLAFNNSINMSGGNEISTFYISASDLHSEGIIPNNEFNRNTFKISGRSKLHDKFSISGDANYSVSTGKRVQQGSNASGVMLGLLRTPSSFDNSAGYLYSEAKLQRNYQNGAGSDNPYWTVYRNLYRDQVNRLIGKGEMNYDPLSWLSFVYRFGVDVYSNKIENYFSVHSTSTPLGSTSKLTEFSRDINSDLIANITTPISEELVFDATVGWNLADLYFNSVQGEAFGLNLPDFYNLSNSGSVTATEFTSHLRRAAFYADIGWSLKNTYYLNFTGRNDWSTTLPTGKNSFFYPSVNMSIIFSEIPFFQENISHIIPFAKLRASYAIIANDAPAYVTRNYFTVPAIGDGSTNGIYFPFNGQAGYTLLNRIGNNALEPEKTKSFEVGIDLKFFNDRFGFDVAYFNNQVEDALIDVDIPGSTGFTAQYLNAASLESKGFEFTLYAEPFRNKNFSWDITCNIATLENNVISLAPGLESVFLGGFVSTQVRAFAGRSYGSFYTSYWLRDENGNILINPDTHFPLFSDDKKAIGSVLPDWTMGVTNHLRFKNFDLSFLWDFKFGGEKWNGTRGTLLGYGVLEDQDNRGEMQIIDGVIAKQQDDGTWISTGEPNTIPVEIGEEYYRFGPGSSFNGPDEPFIEDASWVRLRDVTLSYSFGKKVLGEKSFIKGINIYFTGTNLLLFTPYSGIDPETSLYGADNAQGLDYYNLPGTRSYTFGLKVNL